MIIDAPSRLLEQEQAAARIERLSVRDLLLVASESERTPCETEHARIEKRRIAQSASPRIRFGACRLVSRNHFIATEPFRCDSR